MASYSQVVYNAVGDGGRGGTEPGLAPCETGLLVADLRGVGYVAAKHYVLEAQ